MNEQYISYISVFNLFQAYLTTPSAAQAIQSPKVIRLVNNKLERAEKNSAGGLFYVLFQQLPGDTAAHHNTTPTHTIK